MASTNHLTPQTPVQQNNQVVTDLLRQLNANSTSPTDNNGSTQPSVTDSQLQALLQCCRQQQAMIEELTRQQQNSSSNSATNFTAPTKTTDYYNNACYEDIICKPLKPTYDGTADQLVPFLNRLDIRRQDESWYPITFVHIGHNTYDLLRHFAKIDESVILQQAKLRWESITLLQDKFSFEHPTYNARVLGRLLLGSITDDFCLTVIHRIPQEYRKDGVVILWTICNNIHRNNVAFFETIKGKIRESTLTSFNDDVSKYIMHVQDNLTLITASDDKYATEHNDLLIHLFNQLKQSPVPLFREAIDKWHIKYLEAKMHDLTPIGLLKMADDKIQVLHHAGKWKIVEDPAIMALKLELQQQKQHSEKLVQHLVAHVSRLSNRTGTKFHQNETPTLSGQKHNIDGSQLHSKYPPWMVNPPSDPAETKLVDKKIYTWCTKCRQGQGLWVCRHNTATHVDGYTPQRNTRRRVDFYNPQFQQNHQYHDGSNNQRYRPEYQRSAHSPAPSPHHHTVRLSLLDYLEDYLPDDESHAIEEHIPTPSPDMD
jgi:hypothetical protein